MTHFSFSKSFLTLSLTGLSLSSAWALNIKDVPIQHVTVYPNGALIERQVPVRAGEKLITLEGLPAIFDIAALKVQSQNIDVTAVTHLDSALNKPSGRESAQLKQHIKQLEQQIAKLSAQIQAAELQNKFLGAACKWIPGGRLPDEDIEAVIDSSHLKSHQDLVVSPIKFKEYFNYEFH